MTATLRPKIIAETLQSFKDNLFGSYDNHRLIANIDMIGEKGTLPEVMSILESHFNGRKKIHVTKYPNYRSAFRWIWRECEEDIV